MNEPKTTLVILHGESELLRFCAVCSSIPVFTGLFDSLGKVMNEVYHGNLASAILLGQDGQDPIVELTVNDVELRLYTIKISGYALDTAAMDLIDSYQESKCAVLVYEGLKLSGRDLAKFLQRIRIGQIKEVESITQNHSHLIFNVEGRIFDVDIIAEPTQTMVTLKKASDNWNRLGLSGVSLLGIIVDTLFGVDEKQLEDYILSLMKP